MDKKDVDKMLFKIGLPAVGVIIVLYLAWSYLGPASKQYGGGAYAACRTYLELALEYPYTLDIRAVRQSDDFVRINYIKVDPYGQYLLNELQCFFEKDQNGSPYIDKVLSNGLEERLWDPEIKNARQRYQNISKNALIPTVLAYPPDLLLPQALPNDIAELKR